MLANNPYERYKQTWWKQLAQTINYHAVDGAIRYPSSGHIEERIMRRPMNI